MHTIKKLIYETNNKQQTTNNQILFKRLLLFGLLFTLFSCVKDFEVEDLQKTEKSFKVKRLKYNELIKNKELISKLNSITLKNNLNIKTDNKAIYSNDNSFYIETDDVSYIEDENGKHSYTFKIFRDSAVYFLENLVIALNDSLMYDLYQVSYDITEYEFSQLQNGNAINFSKKTKILKLANNVFNTEDFLSSSRFDADLCLTGVTYIYPTTCSCKGHEYGENCTCYLGGPTQGQFIQTWGSCGGGGGDGGIGGGFSTGPNGGGGGSSNDPLDPFDDLTANPCKKIKNLNTKFPTLKQSLVTLATTTSQNYENGTFIDNTATATTLNPAQTIPSITINGGSIPLNMTPTNSYVMIAHTHDSYGTDGTGTYSIFSWDDLTTINNLIKNNHIDNSNFVFYVITADGTRYALTVDNATNLSNFFYDPSNLPFGTEIDVQKMLSMDKLFKKYYDKDSNGLIKTNSNKVDDKTNFLKFIKEANLGITLFEVDASFSTYQKLSISNSGVVTPTPCN